MPFLTVYEVVADLISIVIADADPDTNSVYSKEETNDNDRNDYEVSDHEWC